LVIPPNADIPTACSTTHTHNYTSGINGTTYLPIAQFNPSSYSHSQILDTTGAYKLYWNVTMFNDGSKNGIISFAAEVQTTGWVGAGISPNGNMLNSDVIIAWVDPIGQTVSVVDRKVTVDHSLPTIDSASGNGGTQDIFNIRGYTGLYPQTIVNLANSIFYFTAPVLPSAPQSPTTTPTGSPTSTPTGSPTSPSLAPSSGIVATASLLLSFLTFFLVVFC